MFQSPLEFEITRVDCIWSLCGIVAAGCDRFHAFVRMSVCSLIVVFDAIYLGL